MNDSITTESDVEIKVLNKLLKEELDFSDGDIRWKERVSYSLGRKKYNKEIDAVCYKDNIAVIVIEAKRPTEDIRKSYGQIDSYAMAKETRYSILINGNSIIVREYLTGNKKVNILHETVEQLKKEKYIRLKKILNKKNILNEIEEKKIIYRKENKKEIEDYRAYFRKIHNIIRNSEKIDPVNSFDEFSKVLFLKELSENEPLFDLKKYKNIEGSDSIELVNKWFRKEVELNHKDIFEEIPSINIKFETLEKVWGELSNFTFQDKNIDIKGKAFEEFLPSQLRGKGLGQFFTPRKIVDFMVNISNVELSDVVVDFACGSGGFLIKAFEKMKDELEMIPEQTFVQLGSTKEDYYNHLKKNQLFGIDTEPRAVRVAKMNMLLWDDGDNIKRGNGLDALDWNRKPYPIQEYDSSIENSGATLILANPPFGIKESDKEILKNFNYAEGKKSVEAESLFLEKGIKLLRPTGRMSIVLPEGVLSNPKSKKIRDIIKENCYIRSIIELPTHTFVQSGVDTLNSVILTIEKFAEPEKKQVLEDYKVSFAKVENVGFEPNGKEIPGKNDLDILLEKIQNNETCFQEYVISDLFGSEKSKLRGSFSNVELIIKKYSEIEDRLDPNYYIFKEKTKKLFVNFIKLNDYILEEKKNILSLDMIETVEEKYNLASVNKNNKFNYVELKKVVEPEELVYQTQKKKILNKGDIVYNPYRINIGSIAETPDNLEGSVVSGAYPVFTLKKFDNQLFLVIIKSKFYNEYLDVVSTGSVRNNVSLENLSNLLVPKLDKKQQSELIKKINKIQQKINRKEEEILQLTENQNEILKDLF